MCGIAGIAISKDQAEIERILRRMSHAITHRGPDDNGLYVGTHVGLAI